MERIRGQREARDSSKLHCSGLVHCSRACFVSLHAKGPSAPEPDDKTLMFTLGEGHHVMLGGKTSAEKTYEWEGILFTPDELRYGPTGDVIEAVVEYKTTRTSSRKSIHDMGHYIDQLGSYCATLGVRKAQLHVFHLCGDWRSSPFPEHKCYEIDFSEEELAAWRKELLRRKEMILNAKSVADIPPWEAFDWEPKYCGLSDCSCKGERQTGFPDIVAGLELE